MRRTGMKCCRASRSPKSFPNRARRGDTTLMKHIVAGAIFAYGLASAQLEPEQVKKIEEVVTTEMSRASVPGVSMAIAIKGKIQWTGGFGMADLENFVPMTADTRVRLASISKPMTAIALMQLVEQGKID